MQENLTMNNMGLCHHHHHDHKKQIKKETSEMEVSNSGS
jgi:hypothetical protein